MYIIFLLCAHMFKVAVYFPTGGTLLNTANMHDFKFLANLSYIYFILCFRHKFLFLYNDYCKKVELHNDNPNGASKKELMDKAGLVFGVDQSTILLQKWDSEEYNCFVDIDEPDDEDIPSGIKIQVKSIVQIMPVHLTSAAVEEKPGTEDTGPKDQTAEARESDIDGKDTGLKDQAAEAKEPKTAGRGVAMEVEKKDQGEAQSHKSVNQYYCRIKDGTFLLMDRQHQRFQWWLVSTIMFNALVLPIPSVLY